MPAKLPLVLGGLSKEDIEAIILVNPELALWDAYRDRILALDGMDPDEMMMLAYQFVFEQETRVRWLGAAISYSWIDVAMFLEERQPSYVDNFASTFRRRFSDCVHIGFYSDEPSCLRLNRVLPGILVFPKSKLLEILEKMLSRSIHSPGESS